MDPMSARPSLRKRHGALRAAARLAAIASLAAVPAARAPGAEPLAAELCARPPALDPVLEVRFDVFLRGKRSGEERLRVYTPPQGGMLIRTEYESTFGPTAFAHRSTQYWRDDRLVCAHGTGVNTGMSLEPDVEIRLVEAAGDGVYEWRATETGGFANVGPARRFDGPIQGESFWMEPAAPELTVVNLGRSAVYRVEAERLADGLVDGVRTRHYRLSGAALAGQRAGSEGLLRELWYDAIGLVRMCAKETYKMTVIAEYRRIRPGWTAVAAPAEDGGAPPDTARPCGEVFAD